MYFLCTQRLYYQRRFYRFELWTFIVDIYHIPVEEKASYHAKHDTEEYTIGEVIFYKCHLDMWIS